MDAITDTGVFNGAGWAGDDVKFVDALGGFINNEQFARGWRRSAENPDAPDSYVWTALSACGEVLADAVYQNVRNYVDLAANVETCKAKALVSMLGEMGLDFMLGQSFDDVPLPVMNMVDAYSVDRKYLFASGVLSPSTVARVLSASGARAVDRETSRLPSWTPYAAWPLISGAVDAAGVLAQWEESVSAVVDGESVLLPPLSSEYPEYASPSAPWREISAGAARYGLDETKLGALRQGLSSYMYPAYSGSGRPSYGVPVSAWDALSDWVGEQYVLRDDEYMSFLSSEFEAALSAVLTRRYSASD